MSAELHLTTLPAPASERPRRQSVQHISMDTSDLAPHSARADRVCPAFVRVYVCVFCPLLQPC